MYTDTKQTDEMKKDKVLWGEGIGGALLWDELYQLAAEIGFSSPRLVTAKPVDTSQFSDRIDSARYVAVTYRLFKLPAQGAGGPCHVSYKGDIAGCQERLKLDDVTVFEKNEEKVVDSELATILTTSRFKQSFNITNAPDATPETKDPKVNPFKLLDERCAKPCVQGACAP
ncbi:arsenite methyltransferase-like [Pomacea canaliculata]|nr:arsenite methyltransferase-like [Pomacea canaliculata]